MSEKQTRWTKEPWSIGSNWMRPMGGDRKKIADVAVYASRSLDEIEANARLIAAAPDLYEALRALLVTAEKVSIRLDTGADFELGPKGRDREIPGDLFKQLNAARAAIAKARGAS